MSKPILCLCIFILAACRPGSPLPQNALQPPTGDYRVYYPYLADSTAKPIVGPCSGSIIEQQLTFLFVTDPGQKRRHPTCDPRLMAAAEHRAQDMLLDGYFSHTDMLGLTPNYWARQFGCALPDWYPVNGNTIESIGLNYSSAGLEWEGWKLSPAHRAHVLGEIEAFAEQTSYGIAVAENGWGRVFVLLTAPGCTRERTKDD